MRTKPIHRLLGTLLILSELCVPGVIEAQTPGPNQQPQTNPATFRVAGRVVSAVDGHPLARAHIILTDARNPQSKQWTASSDTGQFEFNQVAKGKYALEGAKQGFIPQGYNQHEQFSTAIVTGADVPTEDLILRLPPAAMVSVKVTDESSEPVRKASVMLYRQDRSTGVERTASFRSASTDDLGSCEFTRLDPGTYFVGVTATPWYAVHPASVRADGAEDPSANDMRSFDVVYPPTYFGDTTDADSATPIAVKGGDDAQAEIHLSPVPALHLIFRAADNHENGFGVTPSFQKLGIGGAELDPMTEIRGISPGVFEMVGISPGRYKIRWPGSSPSDVDIATDGQDLSEVKGEVFSTVKASVQVLGESKLPSQLYLRLQPADGTNNGVIETVNEKGEASFASVSPGKYNVFAMAGGMTGVKPYSVVTISSEGTVTAGPFLNIPPGSSLTLSLSLVPGMVKVEGFAKRAGTGAAGAMVVLVPKDPEPNRELFRRDQSDLDGSFSLQGVVPGSYTAVAIEDGWDLDWSLPTVIEPYVKNGEPITVSDRPGHSVQLPEAVEVQPHH